MTRLEKAIVAVIAGIILINGPELINLVLSESVGWFFLLWAVAFFGITFVPNNRRKLMAALIFLFSIFLAIAQSQDRLFFASNMNMVWLLPLEGVIYGTLCWVMKRKEADRNWTR